ncbi:hypothetical protein GCM10027435_19430 [Haloparvum alkalitolerans]|uniref:peroxiredoxin family protein n=1 Tax=Haloparvum alkalitolerans TaxID=1042953 RepID=UPI003CF8C0ED
MVTVGNKAPDFIAPAVADGTAVEFELFRRVEASEAVLIYFYPADFVPTCTAELCGMRDAGWAAVDGLSVVGVRGDSLYAGVAYADRFELPFPLAMDESGRVAASYGLLADAWEGHTDVPRRAAVVVDGDWTVRFREAAGDALDRPAPGPVQNATATLRELGLDADRPRVNYDGPW